MDTSFITTPEVRRVLSHLRGTGSLGASPLVASAMVETLLRDTGTTATPESREWALAAVVIRAITDHLDRQRNGPPANQSGAELGQVTIGRIDPARSVDDATQAWLEEDFLADCSDREAWSCLYYRFVHSPPLQAQDIAARVRPRARSGSKQISRRTDRGIHLLAQVLVGLEQSASARLAAESAQADPEAGSAGQTSAPQTIGVDAREESAGGNHLPSSASAHPPPARHNLPLRRSSFVGRQHEVATIAARLREVPLLTLTGPGGVGKTRLMLQVARTIAGEYPDGAWLVELAGVRDPERVADAMLDALVAAGEIDAGTAGRGAGATRAGTDAGTGPTSLDQLIDHFRTRQALIILDNCEHLVEACARTADAILTRCPQVRMLVTSREVLRIDGEHVFRVTPLDAPSEAEAAQAQEAGSSLDLLEFPAVKLFVDRAWAGEPRFDSANGHGPTVAEICRRLDGLPLAIELAAVWARSMAVDEILAHLDRRLALLVEGSRTARPEHQGLRALLDWSYDRLDPAAQMVFRRLAVFQGGAGLAEAEAVCAGGTVAPSGSPRLIFRLVSTSLVDMTEIDNQARYDMLDTIREYAAEMLAASEEQGPAQDRHALAYLALAERAEPELRGADQARWLRALRRNIANLRAALDHCHTRAELRPAGLRLAGALARFWLTQGLLTEGRAVLAAMLDLNQPLEPTAARAKALLGCGALARQQCDYGAATRFLEDALAVQSALADRQGVAATLRGLGNIAEERGQAEEARRLYGQSLAGYRELGDRWGEAAVLNNLGLAAYHAGEFEEAQPWLEASLAIFRALDEAWAVSVTLFNLGNLTFDQGDLDTAERLLLESLAIARGLEDPAGVSGALGSLGYIAYQRGEYAAARTFYRESFPLLAELGDRQDIAEWLEAMAFLSQAEGRLSQAAQLAGAAAALRETIGVSVAAKDVAETVEHIAALRAELGDPAFDAAWSAGRVLDWPSIAASALRS